jgi:hypothetical protein
MLESTGLLKLHHEPAREGGLLTENCWRQLGADSNERVPR